MIKKDHKRHTLALLLTVALMLTLIQGMAVTVSATSGVVEDLITALENYGFTADYDGVDTVTVSGSVSAEATALWDSPLSLDIPDDITVDWQAYVTGKSSNNYWLVLYGNGTFLMRGGLIEMTEGDYADWELIFIHDSVTFILDGGTVRNECPNGYAIRCYEDSDYIYISGSVEGDVNYGGGSDPDDKIFLTAGEYHDFLDIDEATNINPFDIYGISMLFASDDFPNVSGRFIFNDDGSEAKTFEFDFADTNDAFNDDYWIEDYIDARAVYIKSQTPAFDPGGSYQYYDLRTYCDAGSFHMIAFVLLDSNGDALHEPYYLNSDPPVENLIAALEDYGFAAVYVDVDTVTVTGSVSAEDTALWDSPLFLDIPGGITVDWQASVTGESSNSYGLYIYGNGTFLMSGGLIEMTEGDNDDWELISVHDSVAFILDGGTVRNECTNGYAIGCYDDSDYIYISGTVEGDINFESSPPVENLIAALEDYGFTAVYDDVDTVTVTGNLNDQKDELYLNIPSDIIVDWQAELTAAYAFESDDLITLDGEGTFLMTGGLIAQNNPDADSAIYLPNDNVKLIIDGGIVSSLGIHALWKGIGVEIKSGAVFGCGDTEEDVFMDSSYTLNDPMDNGIIIWWNGSDLGWAPSAATVSEGSGVIAFSYITDYGTNKGTFRMDSSSKEILDVMVDTENNIINITPNKALTDGEILIVALYAGDKLLETKQIHQGDDLYVPVSYLTEADTIKAMWWNDSGSVKPLCKALKLEYIAGTWEK